MGGLDVQVSFRYPGGSSKTKAFELGNVRNVFRALALMLPH